MDGTRNAKETHTLETLGEAAARLLAELEQRAKKTISGIGRPEPILRLVAANGNEMRDRRGEDVATVPQARQMAPRRNHVSGRTDADSDSSADEANGDHCTVPRE